MDLLYATQLTVKTAKVQLFDTLVHVHARNLVLCDTVVELNRAFLQYHDISTVTFRQTEYTSFTDAGKADYKAFFNVDYSKRSSSGSYTAVNRLYVSPTLQYIEPVSERKNLPIGLFDRMQSNAQIAHMALPSSMYYTLLVKDTSKFKSQYDVTDGFKFFVYPLDKQIELAQIANWDLDTLLSYMQEEPYTENAVVHRLPDIYTPSLGQAGDAGCVGFLDTLFYSPLYSEYEFRLRFNSGVRGYAFIVDDVRVVPYTPVLGSQLDFTHSVDLYEGFHTVRLILLLEEGTTGEGMNFEFTCRITNVTRKMDVDDLQGIDYAVLCPTVLYKPYNFEEKELSGMPRNELIGLFKERLVPVTVLAKDTDVAFSDYRCLSTKLEMTEGFILEGDLSVLEDGQAVIGANDNRTVEILEIDNTVCFELKYDEPVEVNAVRIYSDGVDSRGREVQFAVWFIADTGEIYSFWRLFARYFDKELSANVVGSFSRKFGPVVTKEHYQAPIELVFTKTVKVKKVMVYCYLSNKASFRISEIVVLNRKVDNFDIIDPQGRKVPVSAASPDMKDNYYTTPRIPAKFNPQLVPRDIVDSSDVIIFAGEFDTDDPVYIDIYGHVYTLRNSDSFPDQDTKYLLIRRYPCKFNLYSDKERSSPIPWDFVFVDNNGTPFKGVPDTLQVTLRSHSVEGSDVVVKVPIPWNSVGWRIYKDDNPLPTQGLKSDGSYTLDADDWDTQYVVVQLALSQNQTILLEARRESFGGTISGQLLTEGYTVVPEYLPSCMIAADYTSPPSSVTSLFLMLGENPNPNLSKDLDTHYIPLFSCTLYTSEPTEEEKEIVVDASVVRELYGPWMRFKIIDARTKEDIPFCYVQPSGNTFTQFFDEWKGKYVLLRTNIPVEGKRLLFIAGGGISSSPDDFVYTHVVGLHRSANVWLPFSYTVQDESVYKWDLNFTSVDIVPGAGAKPATGAYFYDIDSQIEILLDREVSIGSVAFWINTQNTAHSIVQIPSKNFIIQVSTDKRIQIQYGNFTHISNTQVVGKGWVLVVVCLDGRLYIDGEQDSTFAQLGKLQLSQDSVVLLKGGKPYLLDEFMTFEEFLTEDDVLLMYTHPELRDAPDSTTVQWELCDNVHFPDAVLTSLSYTGNMIRKKIVYRYMGSPAILIETLP